MFALPDDLDNLWPVCSFSSGDVVLSLPTFSDLVGLAGLAKDGLFPDSPPIFNWYVDDPSERFYNVVEQGLHRRSSFDFSTSVGLAFAVSVDGVLAGYQTIKFSKGGSLGVGETGSWLAPSFRGRGFGVTARNLICWFGFKILEFDVIRSESLVENAASRGVSLSVGYTHDGTRELFVRGVPSVYNRFKLTADSFIFVPDSVNVSDEFFELLESS